MKKLRLKLDALEVQTFETDELRKALRGTVNGAIDTQTCRISCPECSGPYCEPGDPSYPGYCSLPECGATNSPNPVLGGGC